MNFDLGEVLTRSWNISWNNKSLWWLGVFFSLVVLLIFPIFLFPLILPYLVEIRRLDLMPIILIGILFFAVLFNVLIYAASPIAHVAITLGILNTIPERKQVSLKELVLASLPFYWRALGVMVLFAVAMSIVMLAIQAVFFLITIITLGFGAMCTTPLTILIYPVIFITVAWQEQAINGIVINNLKVIESIKQGWRLISENWLGVVLIIFVVYVGIGMASTIVVFPLMAPLFMGLFSLITGEINQTLIAISLVIGVAFIPLFAVVNGWALAFSKSVWVLTYLSLTGTSPSNAPLAQVSTV